MKVVTMNNEANDLKSKQNSWKIHVKKFNFSKFAAFELAILLKMNFFTYIFQRFCLDFKNTFFPEQLLVAASDTKFSLDMNVLINEIKYFLFLLRFLVTHA